MKHRIANRPTRLGCGIATWCAAGFVLLQIYPCARIMAAPLPAPTVWEAGRDAHEVALGQTSDEVISTLGEPDQIVDLGAKVIYVYKGRKIAFTDGKVTEFSVGKSPELVQSTKADRRPPSGRNQITWLTAEGSFEQFQDTFEKDTALNRALWSTGTPLLKSVADIVSSPSSAWLEPGLAFTDDGMWMSGINGTSQFTGIQSNQSFRAPFTFSATAEGTISHGNTFGIFLVSGDLRQFVAVACNLSSSSGYQGVTATVRTNGQSKPAVKIYDTPTTGTWYTVAVTIDGGGSGSVTFSTASGQPLGSYGVEDLGTGPFYVILAQREGLPYSVGPNEAIWRQVSITGQSESSGAETSGPQQPASATRSVLDLCQGPAPSGVKNNVKGSIRIFAGSGPFAGMASGNKTLIVRAGSQLVGLVRLHVANGSVPDAVAPVIGTVSWGDPSHSFWTVSSWAPLGENDLDAQIRVTVPTVPGTYHILFAMQDELSGADIASGTNWAVHHDTWNDGNEIARLSPFQILQAQQKGCTTDRWLTANGYELTVVPADAITLHVI